MICSDAHGSFTICSSKKGEFYDSVSYFQLIGAEDYQAMCKSLENSFSQFSKDTEKKMIIYLAVPPRVFLPALKNIKASCKISELGVSVKVGEKKSFHTYKTVKQRCCLQIKNNMSQAALANKWLWQKSLTFINIFIQFSEWVCAVEVSVWIWVHSCRFILYNYILFM